MTDFSFLQLMPMLPEIFLAISGLFLLVLGAFNGDKAAKQIGWLVMIALTVAGALLLQNSWERVDVLGSMFVMDQFAGIVKLMLLIGLVTAVALSIRYLDEEKMARFEYPILILFSGIGMMIMVSAHDLLSLYMGLELQSLALYVLASIRRDHVKSSEAGLKYFVLGAISSGMLLFGASLIYGYTGSTNFTVIGDTLQEANNIGAMIGMVFILAGLAFKISAVPFHMWTPDVYEGAPTSVTAFFAMVPKVAAIALLIRLLFEAFPTVSAQWMQIIWMLSALSMAVGAFAALRQDNIKRLLAYSSIGNMGFALVGLAAGTAEGLASVLVYLAIYMVMTAGTFGIIMNMRRNGHALENIADLSGLSRNAPVMAYSLAILMFSMTGIPPLAGFFGKFMVFRAAVDSGLYGLAVFGILTSVVAAYYYIRIIKVMFFDEPVEKYDDAFPFARRAIVAVSVLFILAFIFNPSPIVEISRDAVSVFFNAG
jgi:NADH-quinone oxidoreductase subunit N